VTVPEGSVPPALVPEAPIWPPAADRVVAVLDQAGAPRFGPDHDLDLIGRFARWPLRNTGRAARGSAVAIALVVAAVRLPSLVDGEWANFRELVLYIGLGLLLLTLLGGFVRSVTPRQVVSHVLIGVFLAGPAVDGLGVVLDDHVHGNAFVAGLVPALEEGMKLLPVLVFAVMMGRVGRGFGAVDLCILSAGVGAGFGLFEDLLWGRSSVSGLDGLGILFPTMVQDPLFAAGHLVWSAAAGLGLGFLFLHRQRWWAWVAGPVLIGLPYLDHAAINYRGEEFDDLRSWLLDGRLVVWALMVGLVVALILEIRIVRSSARTDHLFAPVPVARLLRAPIPAVFGAATSERQLHRFRNAAVYRDHVGSTPRPTHLIELINLRANLVQRPS